MRKIGLLVILCALMAWSQSVSKSDFSDFEKSLMTDKPAENNSQSLNEFEQSLMNVPSEMEPVYVAREQVLEVFIRFIDLTGERSKVYSYHQDSKDSLKSEMTLCAEDSIVGFVPRCFTKKIPSRVLDSYLSDYHLELCEIPSVRKVNWAKILIGSFWDYPNPFGFGVERVIVEALSDNSCMNFIHVEVGNYNNYMVKRLLKTFYELRYEMEDAW